MSEPAPVPEPVPTDRLHFALPPAYDSAGEERRHRKERLAGALRLFGRYGFEEGVSGHVTVREPELADCFWANPFGMPFGHITVSDLVLVDGDGRVVEGRHRVNQAAFAIHSNVHRARPEVVAVAHSHTTYGRALAALGEPLAPITQDACAFYEDHALYDGCTGVVVDAEEAGGIASALGPRKAVILRNHGLLTVGRSVDAAAWWLIALERACEVQLAARAAGKPVPIDHDSALRIRDQLGTDLAAWINYQPLWQEISRAEPDLLS
ncbi:class II aldolase/adducin family protein [Streptomyces pathocidini]|uniref:Class II aldolase/adducin family protein n=1 Tax=Streptomyces pathocidini TaxID=1650571 RepID=A0ABW7UXZ8_9ACTN|nr:class II aldolase/adducin family protein [Streptomyces pathocidini]